MHCSKLASFLCSGRKQIQVIPLKLRGKNLKTHTLQGVNQLDGLEAIMEDVPEDNDAEPMEEDLPSLPPNSKQKVSSEVKERVQAVLKQRDFGSLRAAKLSQDDFLLLLSLFNQAGFHFA